MHECTTGRWLLLLGVCVYVCIVDRLLLVVCTWCVLFDICDFVNQELEAYMLQLQALPLPVRFSAFTAIYIAERVTLTTEFLPISFVLPFISPVVFGGVAAGSLLTALAATLGSSVNFVLGKSILKEKVENFSFKGQPPLSSNGWFKALYRRFDSASFPNEFPSQGFKSALLLRLAPILPVPVDAHWYICGTTNLSLTEFFFAHFIGVFKVALLDAFLGHMVLETVFDGPEAQQQAQNIVLLETGALILVSLFVTNAATGTLTQILEESEMDKIGDLSQEEEEDDVNVMRSS